MISSKLHVALILAGVASLAGCTSADEDAEASDGEVIVNPQTEPEDDGIPGEIQAPDIGGEGPESTAYGAPDICTGEGINEWIDAQFHDVYYYYDQVPVVDPTEYTAPEDLVADLRVSPDRWSSIREQSTQSDYFEEGETFGFGFRWGYASDEALRFSLISKDSPIEQAGVLRGDKVLALNSTPTSDFTEEVLTDIFGPFDEPKLLTFTVSTGDEAPRDVVVTSGIYNIDPVAERVVFSWDNLPNRVGYIDLSTFIRTSTAELDEAVDYLATSDLTDLILDFRYNGGGYVYVAQDFASQLLGPAFANELFQKVEFNDRYADENIDWRLNLQEFNLPMARIIVLTTAYSASASEGLANALRPYIDVVLIGEPTSGKPFISGSQDNCDLSLNAMKGITTNAADESVLGGMTPTCFVYDDWLYPQVDRRDALTQAALEYAVTGVCQTTTIANVDDRSRTESIIERFGDAELPSGSIMRN